MGRYKGDKAIDNGISKDNRPGISIQHQYFQYMQPGPGEEKGIQFYI
jgi:hypothetical protein